MRLATWNINSVRLRLPLVLRLIDAARPDVICLQETKVPDELFPHGPFAEQGYRHRHVSGMKGYNGVAILSRRPFAAPAVRHWCGMEDCRHIHVKLEKGPELHCVYVPAGGDAPDAKANPKFAHKLRFLDELTAWWRGQATQKPRLLVGDLNIAPLEHDVWSHRQMLDVVSHTPVEVDKLGKLQKAFGGVDVARAFVPHSQKLYSWWSYRARDWRASDRGRRLDHIWADPALAGNVKRIAILKDARGWDQPSDHVPVMAELG